MLTTNKMQNILQKPTSKNLLLPPLSLYIHIPWCIKKCPYCDFNSYAITTNNNINNNFAEELYIDKLIQDLTIDLLHFQEQRSLTSIFIGGGTPSLFSPKSFDTLLNAINKLIKFNNNIEITMEANPGTMEYKDFKDYKQAGINRISIGAQSFNNTSLQLLGRIHVADEIKNAVTKLFDANMLNFNLDLMYGLPKQTTDATLVDLQQAIALNPTHISWYNLTIEPNTYFAKRPPTLPQDEELFEMMEHGYQLLSKNGFKQYEVSAYARDNYKCTHNLNYWEFGDYLGIGAGAHGKITNVANNTVIRTAKTRNPKDYLEKNNNFMAVALKDLTKEDLIFEFMLNSMRLEDGFSLESFSQRTGLKHKDIHKQLQLALDKNLVSILNSKVKPTALGKRFLNDLIAIFLP